MRNSRRGVGSAGGGHQGIKTTITRKMTAHKLAAYLRHELSLSELVDWAEQARMEEEFGADYLAEVREAVAGLGVSDVRAFGLTWEDCETILQKLGYAAKIEVRAMGEEARAETERKGIF